ncbi:MAG: aminotransferase class I/II-fold pyridoxal phosphate-dependent enzyme [Bacilli bacterium]
MNKIKYDKLVSECEKELQPIFQKIDEQEYQNSLKVLNAFKELNISESDFNGTTGYGYGDIGRDKIDKVFAKVLGSEDAIVRSQFISGTHALTVCLFGLLRPNDLLLSITGKPYDTLDEVIGIKENPSSLKSFNIKYDQIDLINDNFDIPQIIKYLKDNKVKVIEIQRSRGYSTRNSITIDKIKTVVAEIKKISPETIIMVDNCYCEFVSDIEPVNSSIGCDIMVGSLIKNLGGGIASNGAYIAGRKDLINLVAERLTVPGQGAEVGPSQNMNKEILSGLYHAPSAVSSSLKTMILTSLILEKLNYKVSPSSSDIRADIVQTITFNDPNKLIKFIQSIQKYSAINANFKPIPEDMPGYSDQVIMASGSFIQGSSIEISCDGPLRFPYIAYLQGSLTYQYGKIAIVNSIWELINEER